jgi:hypothetical protein
MTLTWRGHGYLGFMLPLALMALAIIATDLNNFGAMRVAFVVSGLATWFIGVRLNAEGPAADGRAPHLTFGQPLQYAAWVSGACFVLTLL